MPAVPNAVAHLVGSSSTNDHRATIFGTPQTRLNQVSEWAIDWLGTPPETAQVATPTGYIWISYRNEPLDLWATDGTDVGLWRDGDGVTKTGTYAED